MRTLFFLLFIYFGGILTIVGQRSVTALNTPVIEDFDWLEGDNNTLAANTGTSPVINFPVGTSNFVDNFATKGIRIGHRNKIGNTTGLEVINSNYNVYQMYNVNTEALLGTQLAWPNPLPMLSIGKQNNTDRSLGVNLQGTPQSGFRYYILWQLKNNTAEVINQIELKFNAEMWATGNYASGSGNLAISTFYSIGNDVPPVVSDTLGAYSTLNPNMDKHATPVWTSLNSESKNVYVTDYATGFTMKRQLDGTSQSNPNNRLVTVNHNDFELPVSSSMWILLVYTTEQGSNITPLIGIDNLTATFDHVATSVNTIKSRHLIGSTSVTKELLLSDPASLDYVQVYDLSGIPQLNVMEPTSSINVSHLAKGVYLVRVQVKGSGEIITTKIYKN